MAFFGVLSIAVVNGAAGTGATHPPQAKQILEATLPSDLTYLQIENPLVIFLVNIDANGHLIQSMAVEATHFGLLGKAEQKLSKCEFTPARKNGVDIPAELFVTISFYDPVQRAWKRGLGGMPMGSTLNEATDRKLYESSKAEYVYGESSPSDLDAPLSVVESELLLVEEIDKTVETGSVVVEYFIDYRGKVCFPRIISSDHESLRKSVLMTLSKTRFSPPTVNGKPTFVRVRQPFNFS